MLAAVERCISPWRAALLAGVAAGLLAACGSDGPDAYTAPAGTTETEQVTTEPVPVSEAAGHSAQQTETVASVEPNGEVVDVKALDNTFIDDEIVVAAGTEVHWENRGRNDHDVIPVDDTQDWGVEIEEFAPGDEYSHVFSTPGTYRYYCTVHGTTDVGMTGTVVVE